jgi:hypothetical protein
MFHHVDTISTFPLMYPRPGVIWSMDGDHGFLRKPFGGGPKSNGTLVYGQLPERNGVMSLSSISNRS